MTIAEGRTRVEQLRGAYDHLHKELEEANASEQQWTVRLDAVERTAALIQQVAQQTQERLRFHIEDLVQAGLDTCFPDLTFRIAFEVKRNQTEGRIYFERDGQEVDPMTGSGGGALDIAAFALRLAAWSLSRTAPLVVFDEPFKFLSADLQPRAAEILRELARKLSVQVIMVTHQAEMIAAADRVYTVRMKADGVSVVTKDSEQS